MKSTLLFTAALGLTATTLAQTTQEQDGPFYLRLTSDNDTLNNQYLGACHAGAALEGLCLAGTDTPSSSSSQFYYNYTVTNGAAADNGILSWNLPINNQPGGVPSPMRLTYNPGSNVAVPLFEPGSGGDQVAFNGSKLVMVTYIDDSTMVSGVFPSSSGEIQLDNWYVCWTPVGVSYFYNALAWVTTGEPHNPTCEKVGVEQEAA